ncbi:HET-domain-containing protein [Acephala macrosclerotiorum]|nr:HET-domain-containing protein [Acephala macrosclerotiorum]
MSLSIISTTKRTANQARVNPRNPGADYNDDDLPDSTALCKRCRKIDLVNIMDNLANYSVAEGFHTVVSRYNVLANLGSPITWKSSSCALCYLFWTIHMTVNRNPDRGTKYALYKLIYGSRGVFFLEIRSDIPSHATMEDHFYGHICPTENSDGMRRVPISNIFPPRVRPVPIPHVDIVPEYVNFEQLKSWISKASLPWEFGEAKGLPSLDTETKGFLRLTDCSTRRVVEAPENCEYVALSYVWGVGENQTEWSAKLPDELPLVIQDALKATLEVALKYLWVDRYCIMQDDEQDKARQIGRMAEIYQCASFTIFAAAGSDPSHGLPGVSKPRRVGRQPIVTIGKRSFTWSLPNLAETSKWSTWAWTYQEMVFSERRLVFTDLQAY